MAEDRVPDACTLPTAEHCSFFTIEFRNAGEDLVRSIAVPSEQVDVLDAIQARTARK